MKKNILLLFALVAFVGAKAQWVDNPVNNTFLSNSSSDAGEVYLSVGTNGDIYVQWSQFGPNSWSPTLQRLNANGEPQWDANGIHPSYHQMASWSQGFAMTATTDDAVVTCFSTEAEQTVAIKINADGTYAWGEQGLILFEGHGNSRTELLAGDDGGVWALGSDYNDGSTYVCYIEADGTLNPTITISDDDGKLCMFGLLVPTDDGIFVVYEKEQWAYTYFYEKEIWVAGYNKNGEAISRPTKFMDPLTIGGSYCHYVVPDGLGGGYAYIWHPAYFNAFNTYVFHFDNNGVSTIPSPGMPVHASDPAYYYLEANATVDPVSHDLLITYIETDAEFQSLCRVYVNRITAEGNKPWDDGIVIIDNGYNNPCTDLLIDAHPYGNMFTVIYNEGSYQSTVKAKGFDMNCHEMWTTTMSSQSYPREMCENATGFINDTYNIVAWANNGNGGIYGQNIGWNGSMGEVVAPTPPETPCYPPTDFEGAAQYNTNLNLTTVFFSWTAPEIQPFYYNLYWENSKEVIRIDGDLTLFFQEFDPGEYIFKLTAVYEDCESDFALTTNGDDHIMIEITDPTAVDEMADEAIVSILKVYTLNGQAIKQVSLDGLSPGVYVIQGLTREGKLVTRKQAINF